MRESLREYAPYLAFFGLMLAAAGLLLAVGGQLPRPVAYGLIVAGIVFMLAWPLLAGGDFRSAMASRQTRFGGNALLLTLAVLFAIGALNYIAGKVYYSWDMTANQRFTLSRQTVQILNDLTEPVQITAVLPRTDPEVQNFSTLIERYKQRDTHNLLKYTYVDPLRDPMPLMGLAQRISKSPNELGRALVAEMGKRNAVVFSFDEQSLTEAIVKAMRDRDKTVVFTTGHGEPSPETSDSKGYSYTLLKEALEHEGYKVSTINLAISPTINADVVVIGAVTRPYSTTEAARLTSYVQNGGKAMVMLAPGTEAGLESLLAPFGISANDDLAVDIGLGQSAQPEVMPLIYIQGQGYQYHTITKDLGNYNTLLPSARSLSLGTPITDVYQVSALLKSGSNSWGEKKYNAAKGGGEASPTKDSDDTPGPLTMAAVAETRASGTESDADKGKPLGRLAVFGSGVFVSDDVGQQLGGQVANFNLALNTINWLAQDDILISIRPVAPDDRPLQPPTNGALLSLMVLLVAPLLVLGIGIWQWWRHR